MSSVETEINDNPGQQTTVPISVEFEEATELLSDALKLATLEARTAVSRVGTALMLILAAAATAVIALLICIVAVAFTLNAAGLNWPLALFGTALAVSACCYLAMAYASRLLRALTLPKTRKAFTTDTNTNDVKSRVG